MAGSDAERITVARSFLERLVETLDQPDPDLDLARALASVALDVMTRLGDDAPGSV